MSKHRIAFVIWLAIVTASAAGLVIYELNCSDCYVR